MNILVTGGTGYIGSHAVVELLQAGHTVHIIDNLENSSLNVLNRIFQITGKHVPFTCCDIRDRAALEALFSANRFDCCMHFAGLKAVVESTLKPLDYYDNNVAGTLALLAVMRKYRCKKLIFSSSATVYGTPKKLPISEDCPKGLCATPYGKSKSMVEDILKDVYEADIRNGEEPWEMVVLRYFNPIGAHESGLIGETTPETPNNLMPYIAQVASGSRDCMTVFGNDYDTPDGTGVRDYIHVVDLAKGHVKALNAFERKCGYEIYNLGTGRGFSVLELIAAFEKTNGIKVCYQIGARRAGDVASCYADVSKAEKELGWKAERNIEDMCRDSWNWQMKNPNGYDA